MEEVENIMQCSTSIFAELNALYPNEWSTRNAFTVDHESESRQSLFIELEIKGRTVIGCSSTNKDFSRDVSEYLLENAVRSAYNKMFMKAVEVYTDEQLKRINEFQIKYNITNGKQWDSYVKMWNKDMTISDLNTNNVDSFLDYITKLENTKVEE